MRRTQGAPPEPDPSGAPDPDRGLRDLQLVVGTAPRPERKRTVVDCAEALVARAIALATVGRPVLASVRSSGCSAMPRSGHRRRTATSPGSSARPVLIETFVEPRRLARAMQPGPWTRCLALWLHVGAAQPGRCHRRRCRAARPRSRRGRAPRQRRPVADAARAGAGDLLRDAGVSVRVPTTEYINPAPARPNGYYTDTQTHRRRTSKRRTTSRTAAPHEPISGDTPLR